MNKRTALVVLLSASSFVAPLQAQDTPVFRSQLPAPILFGSDDDGTGDDGGNTGTIELSLDENTFPEYSVGDAFSYDFNTLLDVRGGEKSDVEWDLGTPNNIPVAFTTATGVAEGELEVEGSYDFQIVANHPDADNPAQQVYTIVVNGVELQVIQISVGSLHTCAVTTKGAAKCWGDNQFYQLGDGGTTESAIPVDVAGLTSGVTMISAGHSHTCAIQNGAAKCWGRGDNGRLGNGGTTNSATPVDVADLDSGVSTISAGYSHTCAIHEGAAKCWGHGGNGRLGNGSATQSTIPVDVSELTSGVSAISTGNGHTCAVTAAGKAYCWGNGLFGRLGNGDTTDQMTPVAVRDLDSGVTTISAGSSHTCAVHDGAAKCWGLGSNGRLGNGSTTQSAVPVDVNDLNTGVSTISASSQTCAIHDGAAYCWGLGDSAEDDVPVAVSGLTLDVNTISAGPSHACAVQNSVAKCWGNGGNGQLGNGEAIDSSTPVAVVWN